MLLSIDSVVFGSYPMIFGVPICANPTLVRNICMNVRRWLAGKACRCALALAADQPGRWPLLNPARSLDAQVTAELMQRAVPQGFSLLKLVRCAALAQALPALRTDPLVRSDS